MIYFVMGDWSMGFLVSKTLCSLRVQSPRMRRTRWAEQRNTRSIFHRSTRIKSSTQYSSCCWESRLSQHSRSNMSARAGVADCNEGPKEKAQRLGGTLRNICVCLAASLMTAAVVVMLVSCWNRKGGRAGLLLPPVSTTLLYTVCSLQFLKIYLVVYSM